MKVEVSPERASQIAQKRENDINAPEQDASKRPRGLSPDSWASSPDTIGSTPNSPPSVGPPTNGALGSSAGVHEQAEERIQGRGVLEKKVLKYQQLIAARRKTGLVS